ncbi:LAFA_0G14840g1_1 [Lachancea sp. 'fantastica']|nr:LAFA_0G14840g1_1 [Lachancea sp. 'fantastica']
MKPLIKLIQFSYLLRVTLALLVGRDFYNRTLNSRLNLQSSDSQNLLLPFNVTRIPGSSGSRDVRKFIENHFKNLRTHWSYEPDCFTEKGFDFCNLVFTLGQNASSYLVLGAHYDSKITPEGFIGAVDSAASCSILLYVSEFLSTYFDPSFDEFWSEDSHTLTEAFDGVKIVFFDGEEALENWTSEDSIYGARHLAADWSSSGLMDDIGLLVLLDLLGSAENLEVPSFFQASNEEYKALLSIEALNQDELPHNETLFDGSNLGYLESNRVVIGDDHLPFLARGVSVLHLIPLPFPSYWHTIGDTFQEIDDTKVQNWAILLCEYAASRTVPKIW